MFGFNKQQAKSIYDLKKEINKYSGNDYKKWIKWQDKVSFYRDELRRLFLQKTFQSDCGITDKGVPIFHEAEKKDLAIYKDLAIQLFPMGNSEIYKQITESYELGKTDASN